MAVIATAEARDVVHVEINIASGLLGGGQRIVKCTHRVRRHFQRHRKIGECLHISFTQRRLATEQTNERWIEFFERRLLQRFNFAAHDSALGSCASGTISAPMRRAILRHATQRLRGHRALHRMKLWRGARAVTHVRVGVIFLRVIRVTQVPRQMIQVTKGVARRTRIGAIARAEIRVVENASTALHALTVGCEQRCGFEHGETTSVDHAHAVRHMRIHKQARARRVQREPGRAFGHVDVLCAVRCELAT